MFKSSTALHHVSLSRSKEKRQVKRSPKAGIGQLWSLQIQKEVISNPSCKKRVRPQKAKVKKKCEFQVDGQEMAVMVGKWQKFY